MEIKVNLKKGEDLDEQKQQQIKQQLQALTQNYKHGIENTLKKDESNAKILFKYLNKILKNERILIDTNSELRNNVISQILPIVQEDQFQTYYYQEFEKTLNDIIQQQIQFLQLIEMRIAPSIKGYLLEVSQLKQSLHDYEKKHSKETIDEQKYQDARDSKSKEVEQLKKTYIATKSDANLAGVNLANKLRLYVTNRNSEFKAIIQHLSVKQIHYHAKSVESLSSLAFFVTQQTEKEKQEINKMISFLIGGLEVVDEEQQQIEQLKKLKLEEQIIQIEKDKELYIQK